MTERGLPHGKVFKMPFERLLTCALLSEEQYSTQIDPEAQMVRRRVFDVLWQMSSDDQFRNWGLPGDFA